MPRWRAATASRRAFRRARAATRARPRAATASSCFGFFHGTLPAFQRHLFAAGQRKLAGGRILGDGAARAGGGVLADAQRRHQHVARADEGAVFDDGLRLVHAVVVAGDGARTNVHALADDGIAEIREVVGLAAIADLGLLELDEISDVHAASGLRA